jgi:surface antigen
MSLERTTSNAGTDSPPGQLLRRIIVAVLIAALAAGVTAPVLAVPASATSSRRAGRLPSEVLCGGYRGCNRAGYGSYGYGQHMRTSYWRMYPGDECTNYVAYVEATYFQVATPGYLLGDAYQWAASAAAHGIRVNNVPSAGAVAVWGGGAYGIGPDGHVAIVERVGPRDRYIVVSQQHLLGVPDGYDWTQINAGFPANTWESWPSKFIHFPVGRPAAMPPVRGRRDHRHHRARTRHRRAVRRHRSRRHRAARRRHRRAARRHQAARRRARARARRHRAEARRHRARVRHHRAVRRRHHDRQRNR